MKMHNRLMRAAAVLAFAICLLAIPGRAAREKEDAGKPFLDEAAARELISRSVKTIQEEVAAPKKDAKAIRKGYKKIQVAAVMIAVVAQSAKAGAKSQELATYRDAALSLAQAAANGNADKVNKLAAAFADLKADANAKPAAVSLKKYLEDSGDAMQPLRRFALGGDGLHATLQSTGPLKTLNGIEEKLRVMGRRAPKKDQLEKESSELVLMAQKIAVIGQLALEFGPAKKEGKKDPNDWREWSVEMRDTALSLAEAAQKKNAAGVLMFTKALNANCSKCHGIFKTSE